MIDKNYFEVFDDLVPEHLQDEIESNFAWGDLVPWAYNNSSNFVYRDKTKTQKLESEGSVLVENAVRRSNINFIDTHQFTHTFVNDEGANSRIIPTVQFIFNLMTCFPFTVKEFTRVKMNMTTPLSTQYRELEDPIGYPHVDNRRPNSLTGIYYVNDSDGDTVIFNQSFSDLNNSTKFTIRERVKAKRGRFIVFNTAIFHSPQAPRDSTNRVVINFNFTPSSKR